MKTNIVIFALTFVVGASAALALRSARHEPYPVAKAEHADSHEHAAAADSKPVNTVCSICGMQVDPKIKTALYKGKTVGFGCGACPATFAADPERYGPAALQNKVVE